jgi:hypothetical protein
MSVPSQTLAVLKVEHEAFTLTDARRSAIARWLMKIASEYLAGDHDDTSLHTLDDAIE